MGIEASTGTKITLNPQYQRNVSVKGLVMPQFSLDESIYLKVADHRLVNLYATWKEHHTSLKAHQGLALSSGG